MLIVCILFCCCNVYAQSCTVKGTLVNEYGQPVDGVHITNMEWGIAVVSNKHGKFELLIPTDSLQFEFTHVSYENDQRTFKESDCEESQLVTMITKQYHLPDAVLSSEKIQPVYRKERLWVKDYVFVGDNILLLLPKNGRNGQKMPSLVMIDETGYVIAARTIHELDEPYLIKDCYGVVRLVTKTKCWSVTRKGKDIYIHHVMKPKDILPYIENCKAVVDNKIYFQVPDYHGMVLKNIYVKTEEQDKMYLLSEVRDSVRIDLFETIYDYAYYANSPQNGGAGMFAELKMFGLEFLRKVQPIDWEDRRGRFKKAVAPLLKRNSDMMVFDYVNHYIESYSNEGRLNFKQQIAYHKEKFHTGKIIHDEQTNKIYALYKKRSLHYLKEIDPETGAVVQTIDIPDFTFVKKIAVRGGKVYFLYWSEHKENMRLYEMRI